MSLFGSGSIFSTLSPAPSPGGFLGKIKTAAPGNPLSSDHDSGGPASTSGTASPMPSAEEQKCEAVIRNEVRLLVDWAKANHTDATKQMIYFWSLKVPVMLSSCASGIIALSTNQKEIAAICGGIAGVCALIDGLAQPGKLFKFYRAAEYSLMSLANRVWDSWTAGVLRNANRADLAAQIIEKTSAEKTRISDALSDAVSTLGGTPPGATGSPATGNP